MYWVHEVLLTQSQQKSSLHTSAISVAAQPAILPNKIGQRKKEQHVNVRSRRVLYCMDRQLCSQCLHRKSCYLPGSGHCLAAVSVTSLKVVV
jgi:hypothetical protein